MVYVPPSRRNRNNANEPKIIGEMEESPKQPDSSFSRWADLSSNEHKHDKRRNFTKGGGATSWATRDGRRYYRENEDEIFGNVKTRIQTGINFDSYENIPVEMTGRDANNIHPIERFSVDTIHELLLKNIIKVNYTTPTPIQKHSIAAIRARRDLMACAQTGSGKTAAFLLPIMTSMLYEGPPPPVQSRTRCTFPVCLVLSPTRELAIQIYNEARKFNFGTGIRTVVLYGGSEVRAQLFDLEKGCDVCVATPGRLTDLVERRKVNFTSVKYLVLDEADRMLDMGFSPQIRAIVEDNGMPTSMEGRQTVMFSATFPREIQILAKDFLRDYIYLTVGRVGSTNEFIRQRVQYAGQDQKAKYLVKLLNENSNGLVLIFVETKRRADMIEAYLLNENFLAVSIHGDRSQQDREEALRLFKTGKRPILVATDVAARGLDISNITHVINCDLPSNIDDYVHRIGRTGRAGNFGLATSFVNENNRTILKDLLALLEEANQEIPAWFQSLVVNYSHGNGRDNKKGFKTKQNNSGSNQKKHYEDKWGSNYGFQEFKDDGW